MSDHPDVRHVADALELHHRAIAEMLHDGACQSLGGAAMALERIRRAGGNGQAPPSDALEILASGLNLAIDQLRACASALNPKTLTGFDLIKALSNLAQEKGSRFSCEKPVSISDPNVALAFYRFVQAAALQAGKFDLSLRRNGGNLELELTGIDLPSGIRSLIDLHASSVGAVIEFGNQSLLCRIASA